MNENQGRREINIGAVEITFKGLGDILQLPADHEIVDVHIGREEWLKSCIIVKVAGPLMPKYYDGDIVEVVAGPEAKLAPDGSVKIKWNK